MVTNTYVCFRNGQLKNSMHVIQISWCDIFQECYVFLYKFSLLLLNVVSLHVIYVIYKNSMIFVSSGTLCSLCLGLLSTVIRLPCQTYSLLQTIYQTVYLAT